MLIAVATALMLSGCGGASPTSEVSLADACSQYKDAAAVYPNGDVEFTSKYFLSVEKGLDRYIAVANRVTTGLKSVDALAASQFAELRTRAESAKIVARRLVGGDLDVSDSDIEAVDAMREAMARLNDLCGSGKG